MSGIKTKYSADADVATSWLFDEPLDLWSAGTIKQAMVKYCDAQGYIYKPWKLQRRNAYLGVFFIEGEPVQITIKVNRMLSEFQQAASLVHEIAHARLHAVSFEAWSASTNKVDEAEAYITEFRVMSAFVQRQVLESEYLRRISVYGPKRQLYDVRVEECVRLADELIEYIIDHAEGI